MAIGKLGISVCDFCGYENLGDESSFLRIGRCIKCGRDFCPKCGEFGDNDQFVCKSCGGKPSI